MAEAEKPITAIESSSSTSTLTSSPVLNISGKVRHEPRLLRQKNSKKGTTDAPGKPKPEPAPTININTFPTIISKILLKSDQAPKIPADTKFHEKNEYVCVTVFINRGANTRLHHMFRTTYKNMSEDYEKVNKLYENQKDLKYKNQVSLRTICARSLYRSIQKDLQEFKWNKAGNVFETPLERKFDEWWLSTRLREVEVAEMEKLFNYIKFLSINKQ